MYNATGPESETRPPPESTPPKPPPDLSALMVELARIRQEVEGAERPSRRRSPAGVLFRVAVLMALGWALTLGPCRSLLGPSGIVDPGRAEQTTPRPVR